MTPLHACILLKDLKAFQRLLNVNNGQHGRSAHPGYTSGSKYNVIEDDLPVGLKDAEDGVNVWGSPPKLRHGDDALGGPDFNVNEKDALGRTALHIACSSPDCIEYARLLLKHPLINVNTPDVESHYTPLHRAMYVANIPSALSAVFLLYVQFAHGLLFTSMNMFGIQSASASATGYRYHAQRQRGLYRIRSLQLDYRGNEARP